MVDHVESKVHPESEPEKNTLARADGSLTFSGGAEGSSVGSKVNGGHVEESLGTGIHGGTGDPIELAGGTEECGIGSNGEAADSAKTPFGKESETASDMQTNRAVGGSTPDAVSGMCTKTAGEIPRSSTEPGSFGTNTAPETKDRPMLVLLPTDTIGLLATQAASLSVSPANPDSVLGMHSEDRPPVTPLKDEKLPLALPNPPPPPPPPPKDLPPKDHIYLDPAPLTPFSSRPSSAAASPTQTRGPQKHPRNSSEPSSDDDELNEDTRSEIHCIFEQSSSASTPIDQVQSASSPHTAASPIVNPTSLSNSLNSARHPPRTSSLDPTEASLPTSSASFSVATQNRPSTSLRVLEKAPATRQISSPVKEVISPTHTLHKPPPPDEDLPFDFHRFLSQLRHRSADPVAKFLRSFLNEFAKKQWQVHEQTKIVHDFLDFIYNKMESCEVWRDVGEVEMDNAREGMEKLVMNRLYTQTFSPAIPPPPEGLRNRDERFPGRRGQHQEDTERDGVLAQKVRIYGWVRPEHLDIGDSVTGEGGKRFLELAVGEMVKMGSYRAPRDKVICVLNCCKVIFGLLRHTKSDESADKFVPLLIYVVLRSNPEHLVSNVQYILRFRNPDKLNGEAGYYLSSLMGAIQFIESLDRSSLTISDEDFERNVEAAVAAIAERPPSPSKNVNEGYDQSEQLSEKPSRAALRSGPSITPRVSSDDQRPSYEPDEKAAVAGLLRTIQKPLSTIGRIFSDDINNHASSSSTSLGPVLTPVLGNTPRHSPAIAGGEDTLLTAVGGRRHASPITTAGSNTRRKLTAEEAAARQASAEAEEARRIQRAEFENVVGVLKSMFPGLDGEIIGDVVRIKEGRVGLAVDACLALSSES